MATNPMSKRFLEITEGKDKGKIMVEVTIGNCILRRFPTEKEAKSLKTEGAPVMKVVTQKVITDEDSGDLVIDKVGAKEEKTTKGAKTKPAKAKAPAV